MTKFDFYLNNLSFRQPDDLTNLDTLLISDCTQI